MGRGRGRLRLADPPGGPAGRRRIAYAAPSAFAGDPSWFPDAEAPRPRLGRVRRRARRMARRLGAVRRAEGGARRPSVVRLGRAAAPARSRALAREARRRFAMRSSRHRRAQYAFPTRWSGLRAQARDHGITILGDVPIYPALDSADVWAHQDLFHLDDARRADARRRRATRTTSARPGSSGESRSTGGIGSARRATRGGSSG